MTQGAKGAIAAMRRSHDETGGLEPEAVAAESIRRLSAGRLDPDHTPAAVTVQGDVHLDDLRHFFPGY